MNLESKKKGLIGTLRISDCTMENSGSTSERREREKNRTLIIIKPITMKMAFVIFHIFITAYQKSSVVIPCYLLRVESIV